MLNGRENVQATISMLEGEIRERQAAVSTLRAIVGGQPAATPQTATAPQKRRGRPPGSRNKVGRPKGSKTTRQPRAKRGGGLTVKEAFMRAMLAQPGCTIKEASKLIARMSGLKVDKANIAFNARVAADGLVNKKLASKQRTYTGFRYSLTYKGKAVLAPSPEPTNENVGAVAAAPEASAGASATVQ